MDVTTHLIFIFHFLGREQEIQALFSLVFLPGIFKSSLKRKIGKKANFYRVFPVSGTLLQAVSLATWSRQTNPEIFQPFGWRSSLPARPAYKGSHKSALSVKATTKPPFRNISNFSERWNTNRVLVLFCFNPIYINQPSNWQGDPGRQKSENHSHQLGRRARKNFCRKLTLPHLG